MISIIISIITPFPQTLLFQRRSTIRRFDTEIANQLYSCIRCGCTFLGGRDVRFFFRATTVIVGWSLARVALVARAKTNATAPHKQKSYSRKHEEIIPAPSVFLPRLLTMENSDRKHCDLYPLITSMIEQNLARLPAGLLACCAC